MHNPWEKIDTDALAETPRRIWVADLALHTIRAEMARQEAELQMLVEQHREEVRHAFQRYLRMTNLRWCALCDSIEQGSEAAMILVEVYSLTSEGYPSDLKRQFICFACGKCKKTVQVPSGGIRMDSGGTVPYILQQETISYAYGHDYVVTPARKIGETQSYAAQRCPMGCYVWHAVSPAPALEFRRIPNTVSAKTLATAGLGPYIEYVPEESYLIVED